ncbi:MAG: type II toxin-antitoxin system VapC family toxin [Pseudomonadota bacterium]|nr:type II toxin-antitoxin system VapC family toxin [Pseudomonadota bacterium]
MKVLIDTHALLWLLADDPRLSDTARRTFLEIDNRVYFSIASLWELTVKVSIGKLRLAREWLPEIQDEMNANTIRWLAIAPEHCAVLATLPFHHRDPFDRMLVSQAVVEDMALLSRDPQLRAYPVPCVW